MKSMFDNYFGGAINSRAEMQAKIRTMNKDGSVMQDVQLALSSRTPAQQVSDREKIAKEKQWQTILNTKSGAPYVGDIVERP